MLLERKKYAVYALLYWVSTLFLTYLMNISESRFCIASYKLDGHNGNVVKFYHY